MLSGSLALDGSATASGDASTTLGELSTLGVKDVLRGELFGSGSPSMRPSADGGAAAAASVAVNRVPLGAGASRPPPT